jgi:hypothetical protein
MAQNEKAWINAEQKNKKGLELKKITPNDKSSIMPKLRIEIENAIKACHKYFEETLRRTSIDRGKPPNAKKANSIEKNTPNISIAKKV